MLQPEQEPVPVDKLDVGLDRAIIPETDQIQLPESCTAEKRSAESNVQPDCSVSASHNVVDSIKTKKHKAGVKIRRKLHIGRASDDRDLATIAIAANHQASDSRYVVDAPEPDYATLKDFIQNPIDTVRAKVSERSHQQCVEQITAKEVPHGDEVDLLRTAEAVEIAETDTRRLLAIQDLSKLLEQRQATYARWTLDRHVTKLRPLPRDQMKLKPRSDFEKYNSREGLVIDWKAYGQHLLVYYAHQYGGQYAGYGSEPPEPSKHAFMPTVERFLIASSPLQELFMKSRAVYSWEHPPTTVSCLLLYSILWYYDMLVPGCLATLMYVVNKRRLHGKTILELREDIKRQEDQRRIASSITELIIKDGEENWSYEFRENVGPWFMKQIADLANFFESFRNFYEWRVPHRTMRILTLLGGTTFVTMLIPMWLFVKSITFVMGFTYFALYPIAVNFPEYRLLVSPTKHLLWNVPTHAEWAIKYVQAEGARLAYGSKQVTSSRARPSPTFEPAHDYNSYTAQQDKTAGRLIVSAAGLRFVSNLGHNVIWSVDYDELEWLEKQDRMEHKHVPDKLQWDGGQDLKIISRDGREYLLRQVDRRDEAFVQVIGFSKVKWQVVW